MSSKLLLNHYLFAACIYFLKQNLNWSSSLQNLYRPGITNTTSSDCWKLRPDGYHPLYVWKYLIQLILGNQIIIGYSLTTKKVFVLCIFPQHNKFLSHLRSKLLGLNWNWSATIGRNTKITLKILLSGICQRILTFSTFSWWSALCRFRKFAYSVRLP